MWHVMKHEAASTQFLIRVFLLRITRLTTSSTDWLLFLTVLWDQQCHRKAIMYGSDVGCFGVRFACYLS